MAERRSEAIWFESVSRWQIKVQSDGERKAFTSSTPGKKGKIEAERKADEWLKSGTVIDIRFEKLWEDYLANIKITTGTSNYAKHESIGRRWLLPAVKLKKASKIRIKDWQDIINAAYQKGLSKKSLKNIRASITAVYNFARKQRTPLEKPEGITIPKSAPVREKNILQPNDLKLLFSVDWMTHHRKPKKCFFIHAWRFLVLTGLRRGELCGIKRKEDIINNVLYIRRAINSACEETQGKNENARRYFVLSKRAMQEIEAQEQWLKDNGIISPWLFPDADGERVVPNHVYDQWNSYRKQHGIKSNLHEMRHTLISVAQYDMPDPLLKRIVGHSEKMDTRGIYGHDVDGELQRGADLLDGIFNKLLQQ